MVLWTMADRLDLYLVFGSDETTVKIKTLLWALGVSASNTARVEQATNLCCVHHA